MATLHLRSSGFRGLVAVALLISLLSGVVMGGCAANRRDQLRDKSERIARKLGEEQRRVVAMDQLDSTRAARLDHLTQLRASLSAANIALGAVPRFLRDSEQQTAFDILDEVYSTIDWNIALGPTEPRKPMPREFSTGVLKLDD